MNTQHLTSSGDQAASKPSDVTSRPPSPAKSGLPWWKIMLPALAMGPLALLLVFVVGSTDTGLSRLLASAPPLFWVAIWVGVPLVLGVLLADWRWPIWCFIAPIVQTPAALAALELYATLNTTLGTSGPTTVSALSGDPGFVFGVAGPVLAVLFTPGAAVGTIIGRYFSIKA